MRSKLINPCIVLLLTFTFAHFGLIAQKPKITKIDMQINNNLVEVFYDLAGKPNKKVKVTFILRRESQPGFKYIPKSAVGDIGKGSFVGEGKKITWDYLKEFTPEPNATDYYAEVIVKSINNSWLYYVIGGIVVGGGVTAAVLLSGGKSTDVNNKMPFPVPIRP